MSGNRFYCCISEQYNYLTIPNTEEVVRFGDKATFNCAAVGSYINLTWKFERSTLVCGTDGCNNNAAMIREEISRDDRNGNTTINSQLVIDTGVLDYQFSGLSFTVYCKLIQRIPRNISIQGHIIGTYSSCSCYKFTDYL